MYCMTCGAELPDIARFCVKCGNPVSAAASGGPSRTPSPPPVAAPIEKKLGVVRYRNNNGQMTVSNQRISWSDGATLELGNVREVDVKKFDDKWFLCLLRRDNAEYDYTDFVKDEALADEAQTLVLGGLKQFRAAHPAGSPQATASGAIPRVEYQEIIVPLGIEGTAAMGIGIDQEHAIRQAAMNVGTLANSKITAALQAEGQHGWYPDGPTDLLSLLIAGRLGWRRTGGILGGWKFTFDAAKIRMSRENR
jgi:hypothetical protein